MGLGGEARAGRPASFVLQAQFSDGRSQTIHIRAARSLVGALDCDLVVDEPDVSPQHAEVLFRDGIVGVRDLGSEIGTWVGGRRVERAILRPGRWFRVGRSTFELVDVHAGDEPLDEVRGGSGPAVLDVSVVPDKSQRRAAPPDPPTTIHPRTPPPRRALPARARARAQAAAAVAAPPEHAPAVIIAEADAASRRWLAQAVSQGFPCVPAPSGAEVLRAAAAAPRGLVIVGRQLLDMTPDALVSALGEPALRERVRIIAVEGVAPACDRVFYRIGPGLAAADLLGIVRSAAKPGRTAAVVPITSAHAWSSKLVFDICATVGTRPDPGPAAAAVEEGVARLIAVSRARCAFYDADSGLVWTESADAPIETVAKTGIVGFVARTGRAVHAPVASSDPRYDASVDDPGGSGNEAILAVPAVGGDGEVHAVLVAVRAPTQGYFDQRACDTLAELGREVGPVLQRLGALVQAQEVLEQQGGGNALQLFRPEALQAQREQGEHGDVIRVSPQWARVMYWALLGMLVLGLLGVSTGEISQYSTGPCVVRQEGRAEVFASGAGALAAIEVAAGDRVREGQVVARLADVTERAAYDATRNDFHAQLRSRLLDPTDEAAAAQAQALRRQLEAAEAALEQRVLRAPHDGVVTDIGVDAGQHLDVGNSVMAIVDDRVEALEVVAFLPGGDRPQIEPGMSLRLALTGFDYAYQDVVVETISEGVVGPNEAKRLLGPQLADTLPIGGGVVMVRSRLPGTTFESDGQVFPFHDGMGGTAELRLRDETVLEMIIPALKEL